MPASPARTYKPTKEELAAIAEGEAEIARGEFVTISELFKRFPSSLMRRTVVVASSAQKQFRKLPVRIGNRFKPCYSK
jgi:hypothetical protein